MSDKLGPRDEEFTRQFFSPPEYEERGEVPNPDGNKYSEEMIKSFSESPDYIKELLISLKKLGRAFTKEDLKEEDPWKGEEDPWKGEEEFDPHNFLAEEANSRFFEFDDEDYWDEEDDWFEDDEDYWDEEDDWFEDGEEYWDEEDDWFEDGEDYLDEEESDPTLDFILQGFRGLKKENESLKRAIHRIVEAVNPDNRSTCVDSLVSNILLAISQELTAGYSDE